MASEGFEQWAVIELFGHQRIAGHVTEAQIGGGSFVRVDVPEVQKRDRVQPGFTKYFGPAAIYAITPCDEVIARQAAQDIEGWREPVPVAIPAFREPSPEAVRIAAGTETGWDDDGEDDDERSF